MSAKRGTYLITFADGDQVIFGNNYKPWWLHAREYIYYNKGDRAAIAEHGWRYEHIVGVVSGVSYSNQPFYDDGGLKWCNIKGYQEVIDDVCQRDRLAPVKVEDIVFLYSSTDKATLTKKLKEY